MIRIAYICADPGVPVFGCKGCSIHVREVVRALRDRGAAIDLVAARSGGKAPADFASIPFHHLPIADARSATEREHAGLAANRRLWALLDEMGGVDLVYERYSLWSHAGMEWAARRRIPGLLEVNAPLITEQSTHRTLIHRAKAEVVARSAFGHAAALFAVSDETASYLETLREARGRVHVVPNGVDPTRFVPRGNAERAPVRPFTIGFVGTLKPWHGVELLISAFAQAVERLGPMRLLLVGDGPQRGRLQQRCHELKLGPWVQFTGAIAPDAIPGLLGCMDVAVAPYPQIERFYFSPLKVYEYMAAGLPVIASRIGQVAQALEHGRTGWLVAPGNVAELTNALETLRHDGELRRRLGAAARDHVCRHCTWGAVGAKVLDLAAQIGASSVAAVACSFP
jgi:glycosyltransferase involved in cell wall biosynthesis